MPPGHPVRSPAIIPTAAAVLTIMSRRGTARSSSVRRGSYSCIVSDVLNIPLWPSQHHRQNCPSPERRAHHYCSLLKLFSAWGYFLLSVYITRKKKSKILNDIQSNTFPGVPRKGNFVRCKSDTKAGIRPTIGILSLDPVLEFTILSISAQPSGHFQQMRLQSWVSPLGPSTGFRTSSS